MNDLHAMMPKSKHDTAKAEAIVALGYPAVAPLLPEMLTWLQDRNWPVGLIFKPFLVSLGPMIAPHLRAILATSDEFWKYSVIVDLVAQSSALARLLVPELRRMAEQPTPGEVAEGLPDEAQIILASISTDAADYDVAARHSSSGGRGSQVSCATHCRNAERNSGDVWPSGLPLYRPAAAKPHWYSRTMRRPPRNIARS
jgi:Domain of unknown function (DUF5071)